MKMLKASLILLLAVVVLSIVFRVVSPTVDNVMRGAGNMVSQSMIAPSMPSSYGMGGGYDMDASYAYDYAEEAAYDGYGGRSAKLSLTNIGIPPMPPMPGGTVGGNAEDFEATDYGVTIETTDKDDACRGIAQLKELDYVVFENTNEYETGCSFSFKVEREKVVEVLAVLEAFDPKDMSESTYTIKRQLDDFTSEVDTLKKKLSSIDETLDSALAAYDEITELATRTQNAEALAKIFDSKIGIIERLTEERINIVAQLERLERSKLEQLDRLVYTHFNVSVYESKFVDGEALVDSWKEALRQFVRDVNAAIQGATLQLISFIFIAAQYILYFFILLFVVKYLWKATKNIWNSQ